MKKCPRCQTTKENEEFSRHAGRSDGLQGHCRACQKKIDHSRWDDPDRASAHYEKKRVRILAMQDRLFDFLSAHPCECGEGRPVLLEFDHVDPETKVRAVTDMVRRGYRWETVEAEIAKCVVRCVVCHRLRTAEQFGWRALSFG